MAVTLPFDERGRGPAVVLLHAGGAGHLAPLQAPGGLLELAVELLGWPERKRS